ncbi:MAG: hypothetical protein ACYTBJ_23730 [Planctomycetota bacterium]
MAPDKGICQAVFPDALSCCAEACFPPFRIDHGTIPVAGSRRRGSHASGQFACKGRKPTVDIQLFIRAEQQHGGVQDLLKRLSIRELVPIGKGPIIKFYKYLEKNAFMC